MKLSSSDFATAGSSRKTNETPVMAMTILGVSCLVGIVGLLVGAFSSIDTTEGVAQCVTSDASIVGETTQTLLFFAFGYLSMLVTKRRNDLARQVDKALCSINSIVASTVATLMCTIASARASRLSLPRVPWFNKSNMAIIVATTLCTVCIASLLISAFAAEPDADPTDQGFASESSTAMKVFTVGWMFILSFKLRRELVGLVGSSCLLQPW